jgi:hypothetical protein
MPARRACFAELLNQQSTHGEQRLECCLKCEHNRQLDAFGPIVLAGQLLIERQMLRIDCPLPGDADLLFTDELTIRRFEVRVCQFGNRHEATICRRC